MPYEWRIAKNGTRRYVRVDGDTRIERISEAPRGGEMAIEPPDGPVVAKVESTDAEVIPVVDVEAAAVAVPTTKAPAKRRGTRKKKS